VPAQAEVRQPHIPVLVDTNVLWFQVTVRKSMLERPVLDHQSVQGPTGAALRENANMCLVLNDVVNLKDIRMMEESQNIDPWDELMDDVGAFKLFTCDDFACIECVHRDVLAENDNTMWPRPIVLTQVILAEGRREINGNAACQGFCDHFGRGSCVNRDRMVPIESTSNLVSKQARLASDALVSGAIPFAVAVWPDRTESQSCQKGWNPA
jgi:hypothetical protein